MIVVKPKNSTLFSLGIFITLSLVAGSYGLHAYLKDSMYWYHYVGLLVFAPLGMGLLMRTIFKYSVINIGKGTISIRYPFRFTKRSYKLNRLEKWRETTVKTAGGKFRELEMTFDDKKSVNLSMQEHDNYSQVITYLKKKSAKKMVS